MPEIPDISYKFHKRGGHAVIYMIVKQESGSTSYYQYESIEGHRYIMKSVKAGTTTTYTYATPENNSDKTTAQMWTDRATLAYQSFYDEFG